MKALVTGGAGFIGSSVVRELLNNGHEVTVIDNLSSGYKSNIEGLDINFVQGDILDKELVESLCQGKDVVFHLAASVGRQRSIDNPVLDAQINLIGTTNILEGIRKHKVKRIVYSSSAAILASETISSAFNLDSAIKSFDCACESIISCSASDSAFFIIAIASDISAIINHHGVFIFVEQYIYLLLLNFD